MTASIIFAPFHSKNLRQKALIGNAKVQPEDLNPMFLFFTFLSKSFGE